MLKNSIKRYFLILYAGYYFWSSFKDKYSLSKDMIIGHLSFVVCIIFIVFIAILSRLNIIQGGLNLKEYREIILAVTGAVAYVLIVKPIDWYITKHITPESIEILFKQGNFTKKNTLKYFLWSVFGFVFLLLFLAAFIKLLVYPIIDFLKTF